MVVYRILKDGEEIDRIVSSEEHCAVYCANNNYTYEVELPKSDPDPVPATAPLTDMDKLAAAYLEGVNEV